MPEMTVESRRPRMRARVADPGAREFLRKADPVLGELIDARPDFRPRAWLDELPPLDAFGTLVFQVAGQQLSENRVSLVQELPRSGIGNPGSYAGATALDGHLRHHRVLNS